MTMATLLNLLMQPMVSALTVPLAAAVICLLLPRGAHRLHGVLAVAAAAITVWLVWRVFSAGARPARP